MKFLIDAQLPMRLARQLVRIMTCCMRHRYPMAIARVIETGDISNNDLLALFDKYLNDIVTALEDSPFVQLTYDRLILHDGRR